MSHKIEIFVSNCPLCKETLEVINSIVCPKCEVIERVCSGDTCCQEAKDYNIKAVPTIVIDGEVAFVGRPTMEEAKKIFPNIAS